MKILLHWIYMTGLGLCIGLVFCVAVFGMAKLAFGAPPRSEGNTLWEPHGPNHQLYKLYEIFDDHPPREDPPENRRYKNFFDEKREQDHYADEDDVCRQR